MLCKHQQNISLSCLAQFAAGVRFPLHIPFIMKHKEARTSKHNAFDYFSSEREQPGTDAKEERGVTGWSCFRLLKSILFCVEKGSCGSYCESEGQVERCAFELHFV